MTEFDMKVELKDRISYESFFIFLFFCNLLFFFVIYLDAFLFLNFFFVGTHCKYTASSLVVVRECWYNFFFFFFFSETLSEIHEPPNHEHSLANT